MPGSSSAARYSGTPETAIDFDIRQIHEQGFDRFANAVFAGTLSASYWDTLLPQVMNTSSANSPYFRVFQAAQVKLHDKGFLSNSITIHDLILNKCDVHHIFPSNYLKGKGLPRSRYNQIANYALTQTEINIAISDKAPAVYFGQLVEQCRGGAKPYGGITDLSELQTNLAMNCIPASLLHDPNPDYETFLEARRKLMADRIKTYFNTL